MKSTILNLFLFLLPIFCLSQEASTFTLAKTPTGEVKIPGEWTEVKTMEDSGQIYFLNKEKVIIAIAQNPKKAYPFYKKGLSDFDLVTEFYKWDSDYQKELKNKTNKLKENAELEYIIWKYSDGDYDNFFLFGSVKSNFLNILVYTKLWDEDKKVLFLEEIYKINKK